MMRNGLGIAAIVLVSLGVGLAAGGTVGYLAGGVTGQERIYENIRQGKKYRIERVIQGDPAFTGLRITFGSAETVYLEGSVPDQAAYDRLNAETQRLFGHDEAAQVMGVVEVAESPGHER